MPTFSEQSQKRLATCDPRLQSILNEVIKHVDFTILEGHRDREAQERAVAEGKSRLHWPHGNHNAFPSRAVDIAPFLPEVRIDWKDVVAFGRLMGFVQLIGIQQGVRLRFGLDWDGDFRTVDQDPNESLMDAPHIELVDP